ncbi:TetR/AcrR family transcriptional regulator [Nocardioides terrisoli]|uniref:TetR/AcrR family transcriptional regulator n=1 Tax=Nocardioides terrisoli TaxID=3388267 RepID=UPI00287B8FEC|nr:TetR family transcriptional regulator [Nocardioides marmorisolisilvae]
MASARSVLRSRLPGMAPAASTDDRSIRSRLISTAIRLTAEHGWSTLTMAKLADRVGVSRQTVYNELGGKPQLAEAMVMTELGHFLDRVDQAFTDNPDDLVEAVRAAARGALELGETNPLLRAILASRQGAESDLLPLLTTNSAPLLDMARQMLREHVHRYPTGLDDERVEGLIDLVVRLVLSHIMQPGGSPQQTADTIAWIAGRVLGGVGSD